jgi:hypothetical protein
MPKPTSDPDAETPSSILHSRRSWLARLRRWWRDHDGAISRWDGDGVQADTEKRGGWWVGFKARFRW